MTIAELKRLAAENQTKVLESAWMEAVEQGLPPAELGGVLEAVAKKHGGEFAQGLGGFWLDVLGKRNDPPAFLLAARASLLTAPTAAEFRPLAADAYRAVHGTVPHFESILQAAGLLGSQSPRRALRTLDICLVVREGAYLANRYESKVLRAERYDDVMGQFELVDARSTSVSLDPKSLADEYDIVPESDFRVLVQHRVEELRRLIAEDPAAVLIGNCQANNGTIDNETLKDRLVPRYIPAGEWAAWWTKARTAAKRHPQLSLEGRSPVTITCHSAARTLEEEMAPALSAAKTPLAKLDVLGQYVREAKARGVSTKPEFATAALETLSSEVSTYFVRRPADALAASLAVVAAAKMHLGAAAAAPTPTEVMAKLEKPAQAIAELGDESLWPDALAALAARPDARTHLAKLVKLAPAGQLDAVAKRLRDAGGETDLDQAVADAWTEPLEHVEMALWLWKGPAKPATGMPGKTELISRILKNMVDMEHDWSVKPAHRKAVFARLRSGLSAAGFSSFRAAAAQMSEAVAETIKRLVERASGALAESATDEMLGILKEHFFNIFVQREKLDPWADPSIVWTSQAALTRRESELKELVEIKMLENAKAIGAAAAHGDLSENSEWKFAIEERDMLRARVAKMQDELSRARAIEPQAVATDHIDVGTRVTFQRVGGEAVVELAFLGPWESDLENRVYSYQSQMAQELMGAPVGAVVALRIEGLEGDYTVVSVRSAVS